MPEDPGNHRCAYTNLIKFNKEKHNFALREEQPQAPAVVLGFIHMEDTLAEKDLGVLVATKLSVSQQ